MPNRETEPGQGGVPAGNFYNWEGKDFESNDTSTSPRPFPSDFLHALVNIDGNLTDNERSGETDQDGHGADGDLIRDQLATWSRLLSTVGSEPLVYLNGIRPEVNDAGKTVDLVAEAEQAPELIEDEKVKEEQDQDPVRAEGVHTVVEQQQESTAPPYDGPPIGRQDGRKGGLLSRGNYAD